MLCCLLWQGLLRLLPTAVWLSSTLSAQLPDDHCCPVQAAEVARVAADEVFRDELSHNLRTPLSAVRACSQLLLEGTGPDKLSPGPANLVGMIDAAGHELHSQLLQALEKTLRASSTRVSSLSSVCSGIGPTLDWLIHITTPQHSCEQGSPQMKAPDATHSDLARCTAACCQLARGCSLDARPDSCWVSCSCFT